MSILKFPKPFLHNHEEIKNVNEILAEKIKPGQIISDKVTKTLGSWKFLIIQSIFFFFWIIFNVTSIIYHWDPYPFILMNLILSLQAAYTAPIIMMSQNRQAEKDRIEAQQDYYINIKSEEEIRLIIEHLESQNLALQHIVSKLNEKSDELA